MRRIGNTLTSWLAKWEAGIEALAERPVLGWDAGSCDVTAAMTILQRISAVEVRT